jgi:hypothetical protein
MQLSFRLDAQTSSFLQRGLEESYNSITLPFKCEHKSESVQKPRASFKENILFNNEEEETLKDEEDTQVK